MQGCCLEEVPNIVICLGSFWYFGKLHAEERWSLTRGDQKRKFNCIYNFFCMKNMVPVKNTFKLNC